MWEFALVAIGCIPILAVGASIDMKRMLGEDEGTGDNDGENTKSPGGIIAETLLNMRTVSALRLEQQRYNDYENALIRSDRNAAMASFTAGVRGGLSISLQQWINALTAWFGGWLLVNTDKYDFKDFLISNFAILFAIFGLSSAFQDISDRKEVEKSARRIFYLLDRVSEIDPLGNDGITLENDDMTHKS
jgi:ATP-binding cassette, subfamily B (MDR/TAP), member 1